jgi:hypothetical protein
MSIALGFSTTEHVLDGPVVASVASTREPALPCGAWWAWECPSCGKSYEADLHVCENDGTPLRGVQFSLPFIWIG